MSKKIASLVLLTLSAAVLPSAAVAQDTTSTTEIESQPDIVVTARRREENLQDVPIAVSALSGQQLVDRQVQSIAELPVPGLNFSSGGTSQGRFFIRGIGGSDAVTFDAGVGIYVDGVYVGRSQGSDLELLDLERVEVLRGPQGTLFGRNTIGGAVNLVTRLPEYEFSGRASVTAGNLGRLGGSVAANIPIIDQRLTTRVSVARNVRDGYTTDYVNGHEYDNEDFTGARLVVRADPTDDFQLIFAADWSRQELESGGRQCILLNPNTPALLFLIQPEATAQGFGSVADACNATRAQGRDHVNMGDRAAALSHDGSEQFSGALTARVDLTEDLTFKSITSYRQLDAAQFVDVDAIPAQLIDIDRQTESMQFSQEFQVQGDIGENFTYTTGAYYLNERTPRHDVSSVSPFIPGLILTEQTVRRESYALYGQGTYGLTDALDLTLGARYTHDTQAYEAYDFITAFGVFTNVVDPRQGSFDKVTWLANLAYEINPDLMIYGNVATGFKSGGFNTDNVPGFSPTFNPEENTSYELGLKSTLLNGRMILNLAAYQSDYQDQQVSIQVIDPTTGATVPFFQNAAESRIRGIEAELNYIVTEHLNLGLSYAYTNGEYLSFDSLDPETLAPISLADREMPHTPEHQFTANAEYRLPVSTNLLSEIVFRADVASYSPVFLQVTNDPVLSRDQRLNANGSVGFVSADGNVELRFWVKNIGDERYVQNGEFYRNTFGWDIVSYNEPRTYGLTLSADF